MTYTHMPNTHMQMGSVKPSDCIGDGETATIGKGKTPHVIGVAKAKVDVQCEVDP